MDPHVLSGAFTGLLIVIYLGIFGWAWSRRRQQDFEQAARLPFVDQDADQADYEGGR